jgi:hypothetical protein
MAKAIKAHRTEGPIVATCHPVTGRGRLLLLVCVGVALLVSACQTAAPFRPEDPQSLVGEWSGEGTDPGGGIERWSGEHVLTITRVEGNRVFGTLESWCGGGVSCAGAHTYRTRAVEGTLRGNELKIGPFDVVIDGVYMTGRRASQMWLGYVRLTKRSTGTPRTAGVPQPASEVPVPPSATGRLDGVYAGQVCYGPSPNNEPARCYHAKATVHDGKIVGEWHGQNDVTVKLAGDVSTAGAVKVEMHAERADGTQFARANLSGTIQNGRLDAKGAFLNGRTLSFSWTLNAPGGDAPRKRAGKP